MVRALARLIRFALKLVLGQDKEIRAWQEIAIHENKAKRNWRSRYQSADAYNREMFDYWLARFNELLEAKSQPQGVTLKGNNEVTLHAFPTATVVQEKNP